MPYKDPIKQKAYLDAHKLTYKARKSMLAKQRRKDIYEWFALITSHYTCSNCGFDQRDALEFHHKNPNIKKLDISKMLNARYSKKSILAELNKCICLCSNCHALLHARERKNNG